MPRWLPDGSAFLWTTERAGAWQLELRGRDGRLLRTLTPGDLGLRGFVDLDEHARRLWVQASADPTQRQLYQVPLDSRNGRIERATSESGTHDAVLAEDGSLYVRFDQRPDGEPTQTIVRADGEVVQTLRSVAERP